MTIPKLFCGCICRWNPRLQQNIDRALIAHLVGHIHPMITQVVCQSKEILSWHEMSLVFGTHHG